MDNAIKLNGVTLCKVRVNSVDYLIMEFNMPVTKDTVEIVKSNIPDTLKGKCFITGEFIVDNDD